ncbi:hypothetical protein LXL04_001493 [Taraxacum kok-saghyz]
MNKIINAYLKCRVPKLTHLFLIVTYCFNPNPEETIPEYMERDNDVNSVSETGKHFSVLLTEEVGDNEKSESLPSFFFQLPSELKLKILDSVSGVDLAKLSCVCSELRNFVSSDDLWKQKYVSQFGNDKESGSEGRYKKRFGKAWEGRKKGIGGSSLNIMKMNGFDPFGGDFGGEDDREWRDIVGLCIGVGVPRLRNEMSNRNCGRDLTRPGNSYYRVVYSCQTRIYTTRIWQTRTRHEFQFVSEVSNTNTTRAKHEHDTNTTQISIRVVFSDTNTTRNKKRRNK